MKKFLLTLMLLTCSPVAAQWQVPNNTIPIGRGPGVTGFNSAANTGTGTLCFLNTTPPAFGTCPGGVSGPGSAVVGNIAYWANVGATSLGATPAFRSGNPGSSALYSQLGTISNTTVNNLMQLSIGTPIPTTEQFGNGGTQEQQQAVVGTVQNATSDVGDIWGVVGYAKTNSSSVNANAVGVGGYGKCNAVSSSCWGSNFVVHNQSPYVLNGGVAANWMAAQENDIVVWLGPSGAEQTIGNVFGLYIYGGGDSSRNQGSGVAVAGLSSVTGAKFTNGFWAVGGCCLTAFLAGPTAKTGSSLASQAVAFQSVNSSAATLQAQVFEDSFGNLLVQSPTTGTVNLGDANGNYVVTIGSGSGAKVKFPALVAAGMIINDASGNLNTAPISASAQTALAINVGTAGALLVNGGALGSPSSGTLTTGTTIFGQNVTWSGGIPATVLTGTLASTQFPILTGDITTAGGSLATTLATVNSNTGPFGSATQCVTVTNNAKGLTTAVSAVTCTPAIGSVTGVGTGFVTAAAVNVGTAGSFVVNGGALGTPSSGTVTNLTGTASININGTVGATTPTTGAFTTATASTSVSTPIYTSAGSHTFQSNGSTFAGLINTSQQWYFGTTNLAPATGTTLTVSQNTGGAPATSALANILGQFIAADTTIGLMTLDTFGAQGFIGSRYAGGTQASKTATIGATTTFSFGGQAWDGSAYGSGAALDFITSASTWSGTNHGMAARIRTVPDGSTTITEAMRIQASGGVSIGTTTDPGIGSLQVNAQEFIPNATSDSGLTDSTACIRTSNGQILKGSGTLGICLGTSGAQFKTAFAPMAAGIDEISKLNLVNYRYKEGFGDSGERVQYGLTAQQVETVMPDLVRHDDAGETINFDIGALLPVALHAIQQLKTDNDNLRACQENWKCRIFGVK